MWAVNVLAREVTRWTAARRLHRLISCMHHSEDWAQFCCVFFDVSFAEDLRYSKSTSGGVLCLVDPNASNAFVPIRWLCEKQTAVSHSTSEAEVIALDAGNRLEGLPALLLWGLVIEIHKRTNKTNVDFRGAGSPAQEDL